MLVQIRSNVLGLIFYSQMSFLLLALACFQAKKYSFMAKSVFLGSLEMNNIACMAGMLIYNYNMMCKQGLTHTQQI